MHTVVDPLRDRSISPKRARSYRDNRNPSTASRGSKLSPEQLLSLLTSHDILPFTLGKLPGAYLLNLRTNKSWKWLSMITVCIFTLRDAMRTVQTAFEIPAYSEKHKTPPIDDEVALIAKSLKDNSIQLYVEHRPANDHITPVRDLIQEGALYADTRKAFRRFTCDTRKPEKRGFDREEGGAQNGVEDEGEGDVDDEDIYEPTEDDLRVDDEEFLREPGDLLAAAIELVDSELIDSDTEEAEEE
ncbi:hypothetical protein B0H10DRAFT_1974378 [Mycena sp. CBHHK59/15]|nr:hypothetical protein B0H10DRAFT_1974378 [Mycena sp. CBHHK59/15]